MHPEGHPKANCLRREQAVWAASTEHRVEQSRPAAGGALSARLPVPQLGHAGAGQGEPPVAACLRQPQPDRGRGHRGAGPRGDGGQVRDISVQPQTPDGARRPCRRCHARKSGCTGRQNCRARRHCLPIIWWRHWPDRCAPETRDAELLRHTLQPWLRHCEEPTGRANPRPMTGSATKQSSFSCRRWKLDCFASLAMTVIRFPLGTTS